MKKQQWFGFINLNKPSGYTSHDCVAKVRRFLKLKRVGHGGTLDPAAIGVLPIALGKATRLLRFLPEEKAYKARVRFGIQTTTDDLEGEVIRQEKASHLEAISLASLLPQFLGNISQVPPMYSAIQQEGKRLYQLAREGITVDVPSRIVEVKEINILAWIPGDFPEVELLIKCGPGTYIRSIARDLGNLLGTGATLAHLIRTESCGLKLENSLSLERFQEEIETKKFQPISPDVLLSHLEGVYLQEEAAKKWVNGQAILWEQEGLEGERSTSSFVRVYHYPGDFLGIGVDKEGQLLPKVVVVGT